MVSVCLWCFVVYCLTGHVNGIMFDPAVEDAIDTSDDGAVYMINGLPDMRSQEMMSRAESEMEDVDNDIGSFADIKEYEDNGKTSSKSVQRRKRYIVDRASQRWTHGVIPYTFDDSLPQSYRDHYLEEIFPRFEYWTHFRFVLWNSSIPTLFDLGHQNYLIFMRAGLRCWSYLGNIRFLRGQRISCCRQSRCIHEIGHALGFLHEQSNPLRDDFIRINLENVVPGAEAHFRKSNHPRAQHFGYYDSDSFMSYGRKVLSKNGFDTIYSLDDEAGPMKTVLGTSDFYMFEQAQEVYKMKDTLCPGFNLRCDNDGYVSFVNGNCRCRCTPGMDPDTGCTTPIQTAGEICGDMIHLDDDHTDVTITSPGYPLDYTGGASCTWFIKAPRGSQIKLDFTDFEIAGTSDHTFDGHLEIRSILPGEPGVKYGGSGFNKTIISQSNMMSLTLTGSTQSYRRVYKHSTKRFSANLTLIREDDLCYTNQGKDDSYHGNVNVTRDFRSCVPWDRVTHCRHHVFSDTAVTLEGNYCRNPGDGTQPWCYTDVDGCKRSYCDVCKLRRCYDMFADCQNLISSNKAYCQSDPEARRGCRHSCGLCESNTKPEPISRTTCPPPIYQPVNAVLMTPMVTSYSVGATIQYRCSGSAKLKFDPRRIVCTSEGTWSYLGNVCDGGSLCQDERRDCFILLQRNPKMCRDHRQFSANKCSLTCGICSPTNKMPLQDACTEPSPTVNVSITSKGPYVPGNVVTYICKNGFVLKRGSLVRACTRNGQLTNREPVCIAVDESYTETYHVPLRQREYTGTANQIFLLSNGQYRINRTGEIRSWTFYNHHPGTVRFLVWRQLRTTKWFKLIGINDVTDTKAYRLNVADVIPRDRIAVQPGDLIGLYLPNTNPSGVTYDNCKVAFNPEGHIPWTLIRTPSRFQINRYYSMRQDYACKLVSVSALIGPSKRRRYMYYG